MAKNSRNTDPVVLNTNLIRVHVYGANSSVYHEKIKKYKATHREISMAEALQQGLRPCKHCSKN